MKIPLSRPDIGEREIEYVTRAMRTGRLSMGPALGEFEARFASRVGSRFAVATSSGTSALHLCVKALGLGPDHEVLTSSFSFVASTNCLLYEGVLPAFVDIHPTTLNLDPAALRETLARDYDWERSKARLLNRRTGRVVKAILPVHVFGRPCAIGELLQIADEFDLRLIEDACEALGAEHRGRAVGTFGDAAAFAFYPNKQMTTGEGGMIVTDDEEIANACRSMRNQGRDEGSDWLRHVRLGYNYRLSDLHCALGLAQLERLDELLGARARVAAAYSQALVGIPQLLLPHDPPDTLRSWFVYVVQLQGPAARMLRDRLVSGLRERSIACQTYFPPIHQQPYFQELVPEMRASLPHTEAAAERCLALPFFSAMTVGQVAEVCAAVREILAEARTAAEIGMKQYSAAAPAAD